MAYTWTDIPDSDLDPESPGLSSVFVAMRDNDYALAEGAAGAPRIVYGALSLSNDIVQGDIADSAIGQGEMKTTEGNVSATGSVLQGFTLPGGQYGFYPTLLPSGSGSPLLYASIETKGYAVQTRVARINLNSDSADKTMYAYQRYVDASPPNDLGDGEIPVFVFVEVDGNGNVLSAYEAQAAPWHYNGPTDIRPQKMDKKTGKKYRRRRDMSAIPFTMAEAKGDPAKLAEYLAAWKEARIIEEEITQAIKQADMPLIPRPMEPRSGTTVVMLDGASDLMWELADLGQHDGISISELLYAGNIRIDNTPLKRYGPPGVDVVSFAWK